MRFTTMQPTTTPDAGMMTPSVRALARMNPRVTSFMRYRLRQAEQQWSAASRQRSGERAGASADASSGASRPTPAVLNAWVPAEAIPPTLLAALVHVEDPRFLDHHGLDWRAIRAVARQTLRNRRIGAGASTITQQVARNLYLTPTKTFRRKLREMWIARRLERVLSKARILEIYANIIEWGRGLWGCAAAAEYYFGKAPQALDLFEATFLVTLLPAPRADFAGTHAARSHYVHVAVVHKLLLSGQTDALSCARCCARVRELHRQVAAGVALRPALAASAQFAEADVAGDAAFLTSLIGQFGLASAAGAPAAPAPRGSRGSSEQALIRLHEHFGETALHALLTTASYAPLKAQLAAAQSHTHA